MTSAFPVTPQRITAGNTIHHHFYFTNASWTPEGDRLFFVAYDGPRPNLFAAETAPPRCGPAERLTDRDDINPFSPAVDDRGEFIYFTGGHSLWRLCLETLEVDELARFDAGFPSNCSISRDGRWVATSVRYADRCRLVAVDMARERVVTVVDARRAIGHVQFSPDTPYRLLYSGPPEQRLWLVNLDGSADRLIYEQRPDEWVVHESWLGGGREVLFTRWPDALCALDLASGQARVLAAFNAWHACADRTGRSVVCDTVHPDIGLQWLDLPSGLRRTLCRSGSSSLGRQWRERTPAPEASADPSIFRDVVPGEPLPAVEMAESTYGPQWTHPHPAFSPNGKGVVFTSDKEGWPQVYVVDLSTG